MQTAGDHCRAGPHVRPPRGSVALRLLLVLGPDGLAVLQGHLFIVTPVKEESLATSTLGTLLPQRPAILTRSHGFTRSLSVAN